MKNYFGTPGLFFSVLVHGQIGMPLNIMDTAVGAQAKNPMDGVDMKLIQNPRNGCVPLFLHFFNLRPSASLLAYY
jgi:hypothetical protein